jgi:hypothetical protein
MATRRSALESFANAFGEFPPRRPIPAWWTHFEEWYLTQGENGTQEDKDACHFLRTEAFNYDDEIEPNEYV